MIKRTRKVKVGPCLPTNVGNWQTQILSCELTNKKLANGTVMSTFTNKDFCGEINIELRFQTLGKLLGSGVFILFSSSLRGSKNGLVGRCSTNNFAWHIQAKHSSYTFRNVLVAKNAKIPGDTSYQTRKWVPVVDGKNLDISPMQDTNPAGRGPSYGLGRKWSSAESSWAHRAGRNSIHHRSIEGRHGSNCTSADSSGKLPGKLKSDLRKRTRKKMAKRPQLEWFPRASGICLWLSPH